MEEGSRQCFPVWWVTCWHYLLPGASADSWARTVTAQRQLPDGILERNDWEVVPSQRASGLSELSLNVGPHGGQSRTGPSCFSCLADAAAGCWGDLAEELSPLCPLFSWLEGTGTASCITNCVRLSYKAKDVKRQ